MKTQFRECDICKAQETGSDYQLADGGWTEIQYKFGDYASSTQATRMAKDLCPSCAASFGLISWKEYKGKRYAVRPNVGQEPSVEVQVSLEQLMRDFVVQVGEEEGWYNE